MEKLEWQTIQVKVNDLVELEYNPRKITPEKQQKLIQSLEKFNLVEIPAIDIDNRIIGGNQRVKALILAGKGDTMIDVRKPNRKLTESEIKEYNLISNSHAGEFDFDIIDLHFNDIDVSDIGFEISGLKEHHTRKRIESINDIVEDEIPTPDVGFEIEEGDIISIGEHRLFCGSSTETENWIILMAGQKAALVQTDPPYNVNYKNNKGQGIKNDSKTNDDFRLFIKSFYNAVTTILLPGATWYIWHAESVAHIFREEFIKSGNELKQVLIWVKNHFTFGRADYQWRHEPCIYGIEDTEQEEPLEKTHEACIYGWMKKGKRKYYGGRKQSTVFEFDKPLSSKEHPTMKPVQLISTQINNSSDVDDIIVDGFLGSGTTMVACEYLNRRCYGFELDIHFVKVIITRMRKLFPDLEILKNGEII